MSASNGEGSSVCGGAHVLDRKIVVVTGGAGLLGKAFARGIAENGGVAVVADVDHAAAAVAVEDINRDCGKAAEAVSLDICDKDSVTRLIADLMGRHGRIDAVVNNAYPRNANYGRKPEEVTYEDFCANLNLHLGGYFLVTQQFCLAFKEQGSGNVVNMSSIYGVSPPRFDMYAGTSMTMPVEYAAIKSGVNHLTRYFAQYYKGCGIRVNSLSPGGIFAEQPSSFVHAYKRHCASKGMLSPGDIVGALLFLLSDQSAYVTGQNLVVDDGFSL